MLDAAAAAAHGHRGGHVHGHIARGDGDGHDEKLGSD